MTKIHPSMVPAMTDDLQDYNDLISLADKLSSSTGWGASTKLHMEVFTPTSNMDGDGMNDVCNSLTGSEVSTILGILHTAQLRRIKICQEKIKDRYAIDVQTYADINSN